MPNTLSFCQYNLRTFKPVLLRLLPHRWTKCIVFCCGVRFGVLAALYRASNIQDEDVAWNECSQGGQFRNLC